MKYERGSFITVPSKEVLRELHPTAQCLYMWLCSYANETGNCYPSRSTLASDVGVSVRTIDTAMEVLVAAGLVRKQTRFKGNEQTTNLYEVLVVEGSADSAIPLANFALPPSQILRTELNPVLTQSTEVGTDVPEIEVPMNLEEKPKRPSKAKYNDARIAFSWLPNRQKYWDKDLTQLECGLLLFARGEEAVRNMVRYTREHKDDEYFNWTFVKPSDYERKWEDVREYKRKNSV